jgi:CBS domain-containing protein
MTVARILAGKGRTVTTVLPHATMREVIDVLANKHIGALVIADDDGAMKGIVSERDVVRTLASNGVEAMDKPVSSFMTKDVKSASEEDGVIDVARRMSAGRFRHMPVLGDDGRLVGIVSVGDAIKYRLEQMEAEQSALREYISTTY